MDQPVETREIISRWWPLAASWLLMGVELPAATAVIARLANPEINLAAYGGLVFPLCLLVEAPVIMLLATSTALARDLASYQVIRRFTGILASVLTLVHIAVAFTPLWDLVCLHLLDAPRETIEAGRLGMQIMTPWTLAIAWRRFQHGVLIRFGHSRVVSVGTMVRLATGTSILAIGYLYGEAPGIVVAATATATAVTIEMLFVMWRFQVVVASQLANQPAGPPLTTRKLISFHVPLAMTSLIHLVALPLGSAAMGRMPGTLESLAAWPVVNGLTFFFRSVGLAYTEVVVVLSERPGSYPPLRRFAVALGSTTALMLLVVAVTPVGDLWLHGVAGLSDSLAALARPALVIAVALPLLGAMQSFLQGLLVSAHQTRSVTEAVAIALITATTVLVIGVVLGRWTGLYVAIAATLSGSVLQTSWLFWRSRHVARERTNVH